MRPNETENTCVFIITILLLSMETRVWCGAHVISRRKILLFPAQTEWKGKNIKLHLISCKCKCGHKHTMDRLGRDVAKMRSSDDRLLSHSHFEWGVRVNGHENTVIVQSVSLYNRTQMHNNIYCFVARRRTPSQPVAVANPISIWIYHLIWDSSSALCFVLMFAFAHRCRCNWN